MRSWLYLVSVLAVGFAAGYITAQVFLYFFSWVTAFIEVAVFGLR